MNDKFDLWAFCHIRLDMFNSSAFYDNWTSEYFKYFVLNLNQCIYVKWQRILEEGKYMQYDKCPLNYVAGKTQSCRYLYLKEGNIW